MNGSADAGGERTESLRAAVRGLWERRRESVLERVETIERAVEAARRGPLAEPLRQLAESEAHKLAGSAGSFGFAHASELAGELESLLGTPAAASHAGRLTELIVALRRELEGDAGGVPR